MIRGIETFSEHFKEYEDQYILIGGSACDLLMDEAGLDFRATKDLDIVLCVEALSKDFVDYFWTFIRNGEYSVTVRRNGDKCFYRFAKPTKEGYPYMLEIMSRTPEVLGERPAGVVTPIYIEDESVSLSAILLDKTYYRFIVQMKTEINGVILADERCIIALKAKAWLDLSQRKENGETNVDSKDIKKHKNDVYRLSQLLSRTPLEYVPNQIALDIKNFILGVEDDPIKLKDIGATSTVKDICELLLLVYCSN